eukprot:COSAG06_NODE_12085_length_1426_cov_0.914846_2_plen_59_part_00
MGAPGVDNRPDIQHLDRAVDDRHDEKDRREEHAAAVRWLGRESSLPSQQHDGQSQGGA